MKTRIFLLFTALIAGILIGHLFLGATIPKGIYHFDRVSIYNKFASDKHVYFITLNNNTIETKFQSAVPTINRKGNYRTLEYIIRFENGWIMDVDSIIELLNAGNMKIVKEEK